VPLHAPNVTANIVIPNNLPVVPIE
jgi:hypothetical protein